MKRIVKVFSVVLFLLIGTLNLSAQNISVKEVKEQAMDITASKYERTDQAGKSCAVIKVALPSLGNLTFAPSVGETTYKSGQYVVYVSEGTTSLTVKRDDASVCVIDFRKYGLDITSKHTYMAVLEVEQTREVVFNVQPADAVLTVNGESVELDGNGVAKFTCEPNVMYNYTIHANNYETVEDGFMLDPDEGYLEPVNVKLEPKMSDVVFKGNVDEVEVVVNNVSYGTISNGSSINLPYGANDIRIVAEKYEDWNQIVSIDRETSLVSFEMQKADDVSKKLRTRTSIYAGSGFIFDFNKKMDMDKEDLVGYPIKVGVDLEKFITRWFTFRYGLEAMFYIGDELKINDKSPISVNVPLIFSLNAPLGKLNRNHFSVGLGPVLGYAFVGEGEEDSNEDTENYDIIGGGRLEARFTINHFILTAGLEYQYHIMQQMSEKGFLVPSITVGYKF